MKDAIAILEYGYGFKKFYYKINFPRLDPRTPEISGQPHFYDKFVILKRYFAFSPLKTGLNYYFYTVFTLICKYHFNVLSSPPNIISNKDLVYKHIPGIIMKKIYYLLLCSMLIISCVKNNNPGTPEGDENGEFSEIVKSMITTAEYTVPVQEGYTTIVTYKGQTLAVTSTPMTILVPKTAITTKSLDNGGLLTYFQQGTTVQGFSQLWQVVAFEDSKQGDFDYNDLVFHVKTEVSTGKLTVSIHPIALGSVNPIKLSFKWKQGTLEGDVVVAEDCRATLFGGKVGFINTYKYDIHYPSFAFTKEITGINMNEPVYISWYITTSNQEIYAVNNFGNKCVDDNGNPYGLVITDVYDSNGTRAASVNTKANSQTWDQAVQSAGFGAFPDIKPEDYTNLPNMRGYQTWGSAAEGDRYIKKGETYSGSILSNDNAFYVAGNLIIDGNWAREWNKSKAFIYVLDGGSLTININGPVQDLNIYVYPGGSLHTDLDKLYIAGNNTVMIAGQLDLGSKELSVGANANVWIGDKLQVSKLILNESANLYSGCCIYATEEVSVTNTNQLFLLGYLETNKLNSSSKNTIYLKEGGLIDVASIYHPANKEAILSVLGDGNNQAYAVVRAGSFIVDGNSNNLNFENRFTGNLHLSFDQILDTKDAPVKPEQLKLSQGVQLADGSTYLPATNCHPEFGTPAGNGDTGACWFRYPKETIPISQCYDFEKWKTGNFDFTILDPSKVFDHTDTNPIEGEKKSIYQMN